VPPGSPGEPTVRGGDLPTRFTVRLEAKTEVGGGRGSRPYGEKVVGGLSPPRPMTPPAPVEGRPPTPQSRPSTRGLNQRA
jgi:hypothetical protein